MGSLATASKWDASWGWRHFWGSSTPQGTNVQILGTSTAGGIQQSLIEIFNQAVSPPGPGFQPLLDCQRRAGEGWQSNLQATGMRGLTDVPTPLGTQWFPKWFTFSPTGLPKRAAERSPQKGGRERRAGAVFVLFRNREDLALHQCDDRGMGYVCCLHLVNEDVSLSLILGHTWGQVWMCGGRGNFALPCSFSNLLL